MAVATEIEGNLHVSRRLLVIAGSRCKRLPRVTVIRP